MGLSFLKRALFAIDSMTPEEVLELHEMASERIEGGFVIEGYEGILFIKDKIEIRSDIQK